MATFELFQTKMGEEDVCITEHKSMSGSETEPEITNFIRNTLSKWESIRFVALFLSPEFAERFMERVKELEDVDLKHIGIVFLMTSDIRRSSKAFSGEFLCILCVYGGEGGEWGGGCVCS